MLKCTVNGKEIEVPEGTSLIEAFKMAEQDIAHYCWHPGLSIAGVCRLCMVEIEGQPRLGIACNTQVTEGMVANNNSEKVKEAVKWGLDFHLINHPLDCPICDQAGECGLQEQYMKFGQYDPEMAEKKVKKRKVVDLGPKIVLDTERCILCSRCVRFTEEVSKTNELGIFNRGDRSEIGTHEDKPLDNPYSVNTVDICPVGALTSKDFRFKQRVWYLDNETSVCPGCSTGCSVKVYHNEKGYFRIQPEENQEVNSYWMCDKGRETYKHVNRSERLLQASLKTAAGQKQMAPGAAAKYIATELKKFSADEIAVVVTGQNTCEEYEKGLASLSKDLGIKNIYHWINHPDSFEDFDGLLIRGDKNPNTKGLIQSLQSNSLQATWTDLEKNLESGKTKAILVFGPELLNTFDDISEKVELFSKAEYSVCFTANPHPSYEKFTALVPMKSWVEKDGSFINHAGLKQKTKAMKLVVSQALTMDQACCLLSEKELSMEAL